MSEQSSVYMASRTQVNVYNKQQVLYYFNTNKPFNLEAIFHRIVSITQIGTEPKSGKMEPKTNGTNCSGFSVILVTHDSPDC